MGLMNFLSECWDLVHAPSSFSDPCSNDHGGRAMSSMSSMMDNHSSEPEWHNNFGTSADYQSPAESGDLFSSHDWSSSGSGFDSSFGSSFGSDW